MKNILKSITEPTNREKALPDRAAMKKTSVDDKIASLKASRAEVSAQVHSLEAAGARRALPAEHSLQRRAHELIGGRPAIESSAIDLHTEFTKARQELDAIDHALKTLILTRDDELCENITAEFNRFQQEWHQLIVETAKNLIAQRKLNKRRAEFMTTFCGARTAEGPLTWIGIGRPFLDAAQSTQFIEAARDAGLITKEEIEQ